MRTLPPMARGTAVIRPFQLYRPDGSQQLTGASLPITRGLAAFARHGGRGGFGFFQQMMKYGSARPVHRRASGRFDCLQIETALFAQSGESDMEQVIYFEGDFPMDRFRGFFSCDSAISATGRTRQICSLTSTKWRLIC